MTMLRPSSLLNPREVADRLRVSRATVYRLLDHDDNQRRLPAIRIAGQLRVPSDELERWLHAHRHGGDG
jgi:excisionase family DNA binding protein